jgi:pyrimidine operon attenuation protein/uracil phosphoribosyltransferase
LVKLLKDIKEPCIFWLDGHYSYADTAQAEKETPILEEIRPILEMEESHVILIDDARLFIGRHNYPTIIKLANFVKKINKNYKMSIEKDIILLIKK